MDLAAMTATAVSGQSITRDQALEVLRSDNAELMQVVNAAAAARQKFFGNRIKLNYLVNLKSGMCPEDCSYCSQALKADSGVLKYSWLNEQQVKNAVEAGLKGGAKRVCMVASGTGPSNREVEKVAGMVEGIKSEHPEVEICACLGFLKDEQAKRLKDAGVDAYNHNLNTAESNYADICSTHTYDDRVDTVSKAQNAGLSPCSGLIAGMGETDEELVDAVFALRELGVDSVPINFLLPFDGTPLQGHQELTPQQCLRILAMVRLVHPDTEVRAAAGREYHLRTLQPLALQIANSIFLGDYLTSEGQAGKADLDMIRDLGLEIEGDFDLEAYVKHIEAHTGGCGGHEHADGGCGGEGSCGGTGACGSHEQPEAEDAELVGAGKVAIRRRGAGTDLEPNA